MQIQRLSRILTLVILLSAIPIFGQDEVKPRWDHPALKYNKVSIPDKFKNNDVVIINDVAHFDLSDYLYKTLSRTVALKILTKKGLEECQALSLPESFDIAENKELWQQGRASKIKIPLIKTYHVQYVLARIIKPSGKVIEIKPKDTYSEVKRIDVTGEYYNDEITNFTFKGLDVNDILEYTYKADYKPSYGSDMMYFSGPYPKLNCDYKFRYYSLPKKKYYRYILVENIPDSCISLEPEVYSPDLVYITEHITLNNLEKVNYFIHAMSSRQLPHAFFNINYLIQLIKSKRYSIASLPNFDWTDMSISIDKSRWNTKEPEDIRKFVKKMPAFENDSSNMFFMKSLCDTLSSYKYLSANYMYYNDPRLYSLYSTDHLLKRRLSQMYMFKLYMEILNEKGISYYITNVQDKRLGEHNPLIRNRVYENIIFSIPFKKTYVYFVPRYNGLSYFLNELPFYYEGAVAALFPVNYEKTEHDTLGNHFRFVKTYSGNENDNIRIENISVKVKTDSAKCSLKIQESLAGQFSTILRPLYQDEYIDSSINMIYFKKCTDKPGAYNKKWSIKSKSEEYPFKHTYTCSADIPLKELNKIDFGNWYSFIFNSALYPESPTHDFYFDFRFSDVYNFALEFDKPVIIDDLNSFAKEINNDNFELQSSIRKDNNYYILTVVVKVKSKVLPKEHSYELTEFVKALESINNFKLKYRIAP